jgi:DNA-binding SARP family transcriptional activator/TolB-like protein
MSETTRIHLRVLGPFAIAAEGIPTLRVTSRKGCALLAYLAMHPEHRASREHLAFALWGDRPESNSRQCLRQCVLSLRQDLGAAAADVMRVDADQIALNTGGVTIDAMQFKALARSLSDSDLARAAELYRGEFLSDMNFDETFDAWIGRTRTELETLAAEVFQSLAQHADARADARSALNAVERLIALDPLREDWQRLALTIYARHRGRGFALKYAETLEGQLKEELGVEPEVATKALVNSIARGEIAAVAPLASAPTRAAVAAETPRLTLAGIETSTARLDESDWRDVCRAAAGRVLTNARQLSRGTAWSVTVAALISVSAVAFLLADRQAPPSRDSAVARVADWFSWNGILSRRNAANRPLGANGVLSIVVLPFTTDDDGTGRNQRAADGITDDLINVLSRSGMLRVVSRQTAFTYQGRAVDVGELGAELGVRYVVEGSIRYAGPKFAINVDLVDAADRMQVWADRIEWDTADRATAQDELATRLANELRIGATIAEGARTAEEHAAEPDVDALLARALAAHYRGPSRENLAEESALFEQALRREPELQPAMIGVAMSLTTAVLNSLSDHPEADLDRADALLDRAMQIDPRSYRVYFWKGLVFKARREYQAAYELLSKSIEINPSATYAHAQLGNVLVKLGRAQEGLEHIRFAIRLSPRDPFTAQFYISAAEAELELHHDEAALEWLHNATTSQPRNPSSYKYLAATYALLGNKADAARYWEEFRKLSVTPGLDRIIDRVKAVAGSSAARAPSRLIQGLALVTAS